MDINKIQQMKNKSRRLFDYDNAVISIACDVIDRIDEGEDNEEGLTDVIYSTVIYHEDQWAIMKHYQGPAEANYNEALQLFIDDMLKLL